MKLTTFMILFLAHGFTLSSQSLTYSLHSLPVWGSPKLIAEGTRSYSPSEIQSKLENTHVDKFITIANNFSVGASVYREPKIIGIHLFLGSGKKDLPLNYFSIGPDKLFHGPWLHGKPRADYGGGSLRVRTIKIDNLEEIAEIEFLDDITLDSATESSMLKQIFRFLPFGNDSTHAITIKKGSRLCFQP